MRLRHTLPADIDLEKEGHKVFDEVFITVK